ncbi:MAG: chromosomal replication initiator protein DnaA, partial [Bacteroidales bacterium]|nr:chromosomal replication initiator protein DnaA [Bacteroidales bacterium]
MSEALHTKVWNNCLHIIKDNIQQQSFKTWFEPIKAVKLSGSVLTIAVPSLFFMDFIEAHYLDLISKALKRELGKEAKLEYNVKVVSDGETVKLPQNSAHEVTNRSVPYPDQAFQITNPFVIPGLRQLEIDPQLNPL